MLPGLTKRRTYRVGVHLDLLGAEPSVKEGDKVGPFDVMACWGRGLTWRMEFAGEVSTWFGAAGAVRQTTTVLDRFIQDGCEVVFHPELVDE